MFIIPAAHKSNEKGPVSSLSKIIYQGFPIFLESALFPYYRWAVLACSSFSPVDMSVLYFSDNAYIPILCSSQVLIASVPETAFDIYLSFSLLKNFSNTFVILIIFENKLLIILYNLNNYLYFILFQNYFLYFWFIQLFIINIFLY